MDNTSCPNNNNRQADGFESISLLGVKVHRVTMEMTMEAIRGFIASGKPHIIVTSDASGIVIAQDDEDFRNIVNNADLVTPDGAGILKGSSMLGTPLIERVSGVDIAKNLCEMAAGEGFSVYLLGAAPGVADAAADKLREWFPGLQIAGTHDGYFKKDEELEIASQIKQSGAKVLLVAMGIPRQEKFIRDHLNELGVCVAMGVGGTLDVFSGTVKRAPEFYQNHGLEWLYRLVTNPSKIAKVKTLPRFAAMVIKQKIFGRRG